MGKEKKKKKGSGGNDIYEILDVMVKSANNIEKMMDLACEGITNSSLEMKNVINDMITEEKMIDRLKESFVENLYKKKGFVPTFQKVDYIRIIEKLDDISDEMEIVARFFQVYPYTFHEDLKDNMDKLSDEVADVVRKLVFTVQMLFDDFSKVQGASDAVQNQRREARQAQWAAMEKLFSLELHAKDYLMINNLIRMLLKVADKAEEFSDEIDALAIKYAMLD